MLQFLFRRPPSFDQVYEEHGDRVYRFCYRLCGSAEDAEDLAQEVFVLAFQHIQQLRNREEAKAWLYRIALHRWQRLHRSRCVRTVPYEAVPEGRLAGEPLASELDRLLLEQGLAELSDGTREALILVRAEGLTYREAAAVLGWEVEAVRGRVRFASERLRSLFEEGQREPEAPAVVDRGGKR